MLLKTSLLLISLLLSGLTGCRSGQPLAREVAQATLAAAWQADQHVIWDIAWSAMPIGGPLTVETWRTGDRYRFEILESTAPALVGETLIFDGQQAWRYNRFVTAPPARTATPWLAPVSEAFMAINTLINTPPRTATETGLHLSHGPARRITLTFDRDDRLSLWIDQKTQLPMRVFVAAGQNQISLKARTFETLVAPPDGLFKPEY